jgi:hypothetical protein
VRRVAALTDRIAVDVETPTRRVIDVEVPAPRLMRVTQHSLLAGHGINISTAVAATDG